MTETQWIPESNNVRTVNPADGSVENINIPEQAGYYSPEVNAYLFYLLPGKLNVKQKRLPHGGLYLICLSGLNSWEYIFYTPIL